MGVGLVVGVTYLVINFIVDLLYGVIDPRVRVK
jgi:peptide/nickel transport system permease protein